MKIAIIFAPRGKPVTKTVRQKHYRKLHRKYLSRFVRPISSRTQFLATQNTVPFQYTSTNLKTFIYLMNISIRQNEFKYTILINVIAFPTQNGKLPSSLSAKRIRNEHRNTWN